LQCPNQILGGRGNRIGVSAYRRGATQKSIGNRKRQIGVKR
jgi:hypothetical protein